MVGRDYKSVVSAQPDVWTIERHREATASAKNMHHFALPVKKLLSFAFPAFSLEKSFDICSGVCYNDSKITTALSLAESGQERMQQDLKRQRSTDYDKVGKMDSASKDK